MKTQRKHHTWKIKGPATCEAQYKQQLRKLKKTREKKKCKQLGKKIKKERNEKEKVKK